MFKYFTDYSLEDYIRRERFSEDKFIMPDLDDYKNISYGDYLEWMRDSLPEMTKVITKYSLGHSARTRNRFTSVKESLDTIVPRKNDHLVPQTLEDIHLILSMDIPDDEKIYAGKSMKPYIRYYIDDQSEDIENVFTKYKNLQGKIKNVKSITDQKDYYNLAANILLRMILLHRLKYHLEVAETVQIFFDTKNQNLNDNIVMLQGNIPKFEKKLNTDYKNVLVSREKVKNKDEKTINLFDTIQEEKEESEDSEEADTTSSDNE